MGELSREFTEARADGIIEPAEFSALKLRADRTIAAIGRMIADLKTTVRELPPVRPAEPFDVARPLRQRGMYGGVKK